MKALKRGWRLTTKGVPTVLAATFINLFIFPVAGFVNHLRYQSRRGFTVVAFPKHKAEKESLTKFQSLLTDHRPLATDHRSKA